MKEWAPSCAAQIEPRPSSIPGNTIVDFSCGFCAITKRVVEGPPEIVEAGIDFLKGECPRKLNAN